MLIYLLNQKYIAKSRDTVLFTHRRRANVTISFLLTMVHFLHQPTREDHVFAPLPLAHEREDHVFAPQPLAIEREEKETL